MNILISKDELLALLLRLSGILVSAAIGFCSLKILLQFDRSVSSVLIAIVGWQAFIPLAQLGFGRPAYSILRLRFEKNNLQKEHTQCVLQVFNFLSIMATVFFCIFIILFVLKSDYSSNSINTLFFSIGLAALSSCTFHRDIAYGIGLEKKYEMWELVRRIVLLFSYWAIWHGFSFCFFGFICVATAIISNWLTFNSDGYAQSIFNGLNFDKKLYSEIARELMKNGPRYLVITFNETLFYNLPLVAFTVVSNGGGIIYFAIWLRLYQLIVLPMRMLVDARVNRTVHAYFNMNRDLLNKELTLTIWSSLIGVFIAISLLIIWQNSLFEWLGAKEFLSDQWLIISVLTWGLANAFQHVAGSFFMSYGKGFEFGVKISTATLISMSLSIILAMIYEIEPGKILVILGCVYMFWALIYYRQLMVLKRTICEC